VSSALSGSLRRAASRTSARRSPVSSPSRPSWVSGRLATQRSSFPGATSSGSVRLGNPPRACITQVRTSSVMTLRTAASASWPSSSPSGLSRCRASVPSAPCTFWAAGTLSVQQRGVHRREGTELADDGESLTDGAAAKMGDPLPERPSAVLPDQASRVGVGGVRRSTSRSARQAICSTPASSANAGRSGALAGSTASSSANPSSTEVRTAGSTTGTTGNAGGGTPGTVHQSAVGSGSGSGTGSPQRAGRLGRRSSPGWPARRRLGGRAWARTALPRRRPVRGRSCVLHIRLSAVAAPGRPSRVRRQR